MGASELLAIVLLLVVLVLVVVVVVVLVRLQQRRKREQGLAERSRTVDPLAHGPLTSDPRRLKPGDVVRFRGEEPVVDWVVRGTLAMDEDGYASTGTTGAAAAGEMEYADYLPAGGGVQRLSFERFSAGGSWEVSTGRLLTVESIDILHS